MEQSQQRGLLRINYVFSGKIAPKTHRINEQYIGEGAPLMRKMIIGTLALGLALGACSNNEPQTKDNVPQAGTVEEGVNSDAMEIEELPVEEGAPAPDAAADGAAPAEGQAAAEEAK